jgi:hypothetical protein
VSRSREFVSTSREILAGATDLRVAAMEPIHQSPI